MDYKYTRWKRKRRAILRRDGYQCQIARRYGKARVADTVHHIFPVEDHPEWWLCDWNLISVSRAAHNKLHLPDGELSAEGIALRERTARKRGIEL